MGVFARTKRIQIFVFAVNSAIMDYSGNLRTEVKKMQGQYQSTKPQIRVKFIISRLRILPWLNDLRPFLKSFDSAQFESFVFLFKDFKCDLLNKG